MPGDIGSVGDPPSVGRTQRYGLLLVLTLLAFAIEGIAAPRTWVQVTLTVVLGSAVLVAFWAAEARHGVMRIVAAVVTLLVAFSIVEVATGSVDDAATRIAGGLLVALAPPAIVVGIVRSLRCRGAVTAQAVLGGICLYVLLGLFFAAVYGSIDKVAGVPFFAGGVAATVPHTVYFSFTTITTVGYGDYTAASNLGHTLSSSEALLGQIYLVTVVSLLVANLRPLRRRTE